MKLRLLGLILLLPFLAACSSYHPLKEGVGFTDVPVGPDSVLVTYSGDDTMSVGETRHNALIRAAELAAYRGTPYFEITHEHIYLTRAATYWPPTETTYVTGVENRRGEVRPFIVRDYDPGYTQDFTQTEEQLEVKFSAQPGPTTIPAAFLLHQALAQHVPLSPGVQERLASMPDVAGPILIPPAPLPTSRPIVAPADKVSTQPAEQVLPVH
jgi:hypothetical protein